MLVYNWSKPVEGSDGVAVVDEGILVLGGEWLSMLNKSDGSAVWECEAPRTSPYTRLLFDPVSAQYVAREPSGWEYRFNPQLGLAGPPTQETSPVDDRPDLEQLSPGEVQAEVGDVLLLRAVELEKYPPQAVRVDDSLIVNRFSDGLHVVNLQTRNVAVYFNSEVESGPSEVAVGDGLVAAVGCDCNIYCFRLEE